MRRGLTPLRSQPRYHNLRIPSSSAPMPLKGTNCFLGLAQGNMNQHLIESATTNYIHGPLQSFPSLGSFIVIVMPYSAFSWLQFSYAWHHVPFHTFGHPVRPTKMLAWFTSTPILTQRWSCVVTNPLTEPPGLQPLWPLLWFDNQPFWHYFVMHAPERHNKPMFFPLP